ncbi:hypothetical protein N7474_008219 [Penicillium riverlandense]|uniref:uncharacterized protein n=1 Tax=Penicillium riverlandense TaxID=1903569 RepID=UPI002546C901|nr:uncharacterized protein N7474_008219 [Penicillium riverlandense]KAJ5811918.1 hypothetical protein N7474_008219 [Penicillium riverlandense]
MKFTTVAALLPLAWAAKIDATDLKYEISDFSAACTPKSIYCFYEISISTSNNPKFTQGCDVMGTSDNGELPAVSETQCGTYTVSVAKSGDGGLVFTINSDMEPLTGTFPISSDDLTTTESGGSTVQLYTGDSTFTIDAKIRSSASASASSPTASTLTGSSASASSSASSVSPTAASEPSTTGNTTSSSASPSETNGATRGSAFAGVPFAVGLMAFML